MLLLDENIAETSSDAATENVDASGRVTVSADLGGAAMRGVVDVLTFRALMRAVRTFVTRKEDLEDDAFHRALIRTINTNGALVGAMIDVQRQQR